MRTTKLNQTETELLWRSGGTLVTFTAPHNKGTMRDGASKIRDTNVGIIALEAAKISKANALIPLTPGDNDGNWHNDSHFRSALESLVEKGSIIIDVHGMHDGHGFDIIAGTCGGKTPEWLSATVKEVFATAGFTIDLRPTGSFSAGPKTITGVMLEAGYTAIQLEIAARWRNGRGAPDMMTKLIDTLGEVGKRAVQHLRPTNQF